MRVSFHTLGCKLNFAETSTLARAFTEAGCAVVGADEPSDVAVVNSCSVTADADKKCRNLVRRIHALQPACRVVVTGCYAQLAREKLTAIEGVSLVVSNAEKGELVGRVLGFKTFRTDFFPSFSTTGEGRTRTFLKVQDGCDYRCAYCTIPDARGASRNQPIASLVDEAERIAAAGGREIVLTGINTGDFGRSTGETFLQLLTALDAVEGIERYRISSIEPNLLTDRILDFCAAHPKFQPHFHIPLQSGSNAVLGRMRRRYQTDLFAERIAAVRARWKDPFIGIDVIVGFPGETEQEAEETYAFLSDIKPAFLHIFPYSARPGTPAAAMPDQVKPEQKAARAARLSRLSDQLHHDFCEMAVGTMAEVLFESAVKEGYMSGYTSNYIRVRARHNPAQINRVINMKLETQHIL